MALDYNTEQGKQTTKCPYGMSKNNKPIMVGDNGCIRCEYIKGLGQNNFQNYVNCIYDIYNRPIYPIKFKCTVCGKTSWCKEDTTFEVKGNKLIIDTNCTNIDCYTRYILEFKLVKQIKPYSKFKL